MYHIFTFENGQPAILFYENNTANLYVIANGKVINKGPLFKDIRSDFNVYGNNPYYIFYVSTNNTVKVYSTSGQVLVETLSLPLNTENEQLIPAFYPPVFFHDTLLFFYFNYSSNGNSDAKNVDFYVLNVSTGLSKSLKKNLPPDIQIDIFKSNSKIIITMKYAEHLHLYSLNEDLILNSFSCEDVTQLKTIKDLEKKHASDELQIKKLKESQAYITTQYNELAEYAGKLQDELRRIQYMI